MANSVPRSEKKREYDRIWYQNNKERISKRLKSQYYRMSPTRRRQRGYVGRILWKYKMSWEDFKQLWKLQKGLCSICGERLVLFSMRTQIDHSHTSGKIRGILCNNCNLLLGHSKDSISILQKAVTYLEAHL